MVGLGIAAQHQRLGLSASDPDIIGRLFEQSAQHSVEC